MYNIVSLSDVKDWLKITSDVSNNFLEKLIKEVTDLMEQRIRKYIITRQLVEYYDGRGAATLMLDQYPIYKVDSIYDDSDLDWGSDDLIDSSDYRIKYPEAEILLVDDESAFEDGVENVKITYWAGLSRFLVVDEANNYLDITDAGGTAAIEISPEITYGRKGYTAEDLASTLQTALNADSTLTAAYTVNYNHATQKFTISANASFTPLFQSGSNASKNLAELMGFSISKDPSSSTSFTSDNSVNGVPDDLMLAAQELIHYFWDNSKVGDGILLLNKRVGGGSGGTVEYEKDYPLNVIKILNSYKRYYA